MSHLPDHLPTGDEPLAEVTSVTRTVHHAGHPLVTQADRDAQVDDLYLEPAVIEHVEYRGIDTTLPELNYASRSNIVAPAPLSVPEAVVEHRDHAGERGR